MSLSQQDYIKSGAHEATAIKVLMLTSVFPRWEGDATPPFVQNLAECLVEEGLDVRVLAPHAKGAALREIWNGVDIYRHAYAWPLGLQKLCYEGGMLVNLEVRRWTKLLLPFFFISQFCAILWLCWRIRPDIVHSHSLVPQGLAAIVPSKLFGIPHVTTSHGNDVFGLGSTGIIGWMKRHVLRHSNTITVNSSATSAAVVQILPSLQENKIQLIPAVPNTNAPDPEMVDLIQNRFPATKRLLFVGRLIEEKGIFEFMEALEVILRRDVEACALIVGDGASRGRVDEMRRSSMWSDRIHLVGWQPKEQIPSWMAAADVLVVPSYREAQGLVIVEAMSAGTPVVASNVGGIPDLIRERQTGLSIRPKESQQIVDAVTTLIEEPKLGEGFSAAGKRLFESKYSPSSIGHAWTKLYAQLLCEKIERIS